MAINVFGAALTLIKCLFMQPMVTFGLPGQDYLKIKPYKMGLTKINQILKKYKELHKKHQKS